MSETLEAKSVRVPQTASKGRVPETLSDLRVEIDVTERLPYLQPRPSRWFPQVLPQLNRLLELAPNWDSYNADPVSGDAVASARGLLLELGRHLDLPSPTISPTRIGGVLLEWKVGSKELEIEIVSRDAASFLFADDSTGEEYEGEFFRDESLGLSPVFQFLERIS